MSTRFLVKHNNTDTTLCHLILVMATIAKAIKQLDPLLPFNLEPPLFICQLTQTQDKCSLLTRQKWRQIRSPPTPSPTSYSESGPTGKWSLYLWRTVHKHVKTFKKPFLNGLRRFRSLTCLNKHRNNNCPLDSIIDFNLNSSTYPAACRNCQLVFICNCMNK